MGIGIFNRLGFPSSMANNTISFSQNTQNSLNNMPQILTTWQMQDIANSNTGGYLTNPVGTYTSNIMSTIVSIENAAIACNLFSVAANANSMITANTAAYFFNHTNRISGVAPLDPENSLLPHYTTCIGIGKALTYIIYQSDGISNNAVIMGNFGSLYTANTVSGYAANLYNDLILIQTNVSAGNSTLSAAQILSINQHIKTTNTFFYTSFTTDENYYTNCKTVLSEYSSVKMFSSMGDSEKHLVKTLIGTDKLKSRIS